MAKAGQAVLIWSQEDQQYLWRDERCTNTDILLEESETWLQWLAERTSFSFQGREGHLTLLKETRPRGGDGYWYAYRRQGKRTVKKYAGRTADLTVAQLEQTAKALQNPSKRVDQTKENVSTLQAPLLISKFHLPPLHPSLVSRERLLKLLDRALEYRLVLVSAPAGFGKTTLVRQWVATRGEQQHFPPVAWVSLDGGDNDPVRFWRYLMTACKIFRGDVAREALALLQTIPQPPFESSLTETILTVFLNELARCEQGGIVLLDDYHSIISPRIQQTLSFFLEHLPAAMHVVIITRSDPPLPLARLRARNELAEVRASDLRFSQEETAALLRQALSAQVAPETVQRINIHLEGWAAGLRLLLIALRKPTKPIEVEPLLRTFAGGQHALQDYFLTEVFNTQPEPLQRFLLQTSVLVRLTGSLCNTVTGERDSERILETVARANLFLEPLDSVVLHQPVPEQQWYRYHGLFAEAMRAEARRRLGAEQLRELSAQASRWYEAHNLYAEAVESALYAQDYARAAALLERILQAPHFYHQANEYHTLYNWLEQLPETLLAQHPSLCLSYARALLFVVDAWRLAQTTLALLEKLFQMAEESYRAQSNLPKLGEVFAFRALAAWRQDDATQAACYARQALTWLSKEQQAWRGLSLSVVGKAELLYNGRVNVARGMLEEAYMLCEATNNQHFRLSRATTNMLARAFFEQGELHRAFEYYQGALSEAREGSTHSDDMAHALSGLAHIAYERNELETAQQQAEEVLAIGQYLAQELHEVRAILLLARIQHARGETAAARQRLGALLARIPATQPDHAPPLSREILTLQARLALADGDLLTVQRWAAGLERPDGARSPFSTEHEKLVTARWYLAQGRIGAALELLQDLLREAQETGRRRCAFEAQALLALAYAAHEQQGQAQQTLQTLLAQTCTEGYLRLFLDEGEAMAVLLRALVLHIREQPLLAYLQDILRAFPGAQNAQVVSSAALLLEPLSSQEQRVLRLLVPGRSNAEIAHELVVSINTVRTHIQNIYRKLDAHNRAAAVEVARQLHLV